MQATHAAHHAPAQRTQALRCLPYDLSRRHPQRLAQLPLAAVKATRSQAISERPVVVLLSWISQVFTSMDVKAITTDRVRAMCPDREAELISRLQALGTAVYSSLNLTSLVRLDIRADEEGELYILVRNILNCSAGMYRRWCVALLAAEVHKITNFSLVQRSFTTSRRASKERTTTLSSLSALSAGRCNMTSPQSS